MAYYIGDVPAEDLVIEPVRFGYPVDLTPFDEVAVQMTAFDGSVVETSGFTGVINPAEQVVLVEWPDETVFATAGMFAINLTLTSSTTAVKERVTPAYVVVQADDGWHTVDSLRNELGRDFSVDDAVTWTLLQCAQLSIGVYGPTIGFQADGATPVVALDNFYAGLPILGFKSDGTTPVRPPTNFRQGQLMQARNILNIAKTDPATADDGTMFVIRPYPLDNFIKQILRPKLGPLGFVG